MLTAGLLASGELIKPSGGKFKEFSFCRFVRRFGGGRGRGSPHSQVLCFGQKNFFFFREFGNPVFLFFKSVLCGFCF